MEEADALENRNFRRIVGMRGADSDHKLFRKD